MAIFGSTRGGEWWDEVSDLEHTLGELKKKRERYVSVVNGMQMQQNPCPELISSAKKMEEDIARIEKRIRSLEIELKRVRNSYYE